MDRPGFGAPRPFVRTPTRGGDLPPPDHRVKLRDGEREIEVSGNPAFVRQVLDDLPALMSRLRGESNGRSAISMPAPPPAAAAAEAAPVATPVPSGDVPKSTRRESVRQKAPVQANGADLERQVFDVLRSSTRPLAVSAIRERIEGQPTGQEVRRLLERAGSRVTRSQDRPATYALS
jgi:hypothetical protein